MAAIPLITSPQDPSQYNANFNSIINALNALLTNTGQTTYLAPLAADLVRVKAAAAAVAGTITIAAQPDVPRKLQVRIVVATPITVGTLTLVGTNAQGATITEVVSLVQGVTTTLTTTNAFAHLTSGTVSALTGGGDGTLGIGGATALALNLPQGFTNLVVFKETANALDAAVGTVDATAGTVVPTSVPNATLNYQWHYTYNTAA
jgi:hypothetical protein